MQLENFKCPDNFYSKFLSTINGIAFTQREVEVMVSFLTMEETKNIASFLSMGLRNVDNHIHKITKILKINDRKSIREFLQRSSQFSHLKNYYYSLLQIWFEKELSELKKSMGDIPALCTIVSWVEIGDEVQLLEKHLEKAGVKVSIVMKSEYEEIALHLTSLDSDPAVLTIFIVSEIQLNNFLTNEYKTNKEELKFTLFLIENEKILDTSQEYLELQDKILSPLSSSSHYYSCIFRILEKLNINASFSQAVSKLKKQFTNYQIEKLEERITQNVKNKSFNILSFVSFLEHFRKLKIGWLYLVSGLCISAIISSFLIFIQKSNEKTSGQFEFVIPSSSTLLKRSDLIGDIKEKLNLQKDIKNIILIGPGGAGKTTLARQYASQHKALVKWEINAETKSSLIDSFEKLAYDLIQNDEEKKILRSMQEIKDSQKREQKLFKFIKEKLRLRENWLLIYDNVKTFSDIQNYFPYNSNEWGKGEIILTSRNKNIENNKHINHIVPITDLSFSEKEQLFIKIISNGGSHELTAQSTKGLKQFLEILPSLPLDVSTAAYYIKSTSISYQEYSKRLSELNQEFITTQENILKEASDYTKTRYGIITLSLKKIIETNPDFKGLLLFITLLDSQNIPRELLDGYKGNIIIDNLLIQLKKYSLIDNIYSTEIGPVFSLHRSTQSIIFNYLKDNLKLYSNNKLLEYILLSFEKYINNAEDQENFSKLKALVIHAESLLQYAFLFDKLSIAKIRGEVASVYHGISKYQRARNLLEENFIILNVRKYQNSNVFARTLTHLSSLYWRFGDFPKGLELAVKAQKIYDQNDTKDYQGMAESLDSSGASYAGMGKLKEASESYEKALIIYNNRLPEKLGRKAHILAKLGHLFIGTDFIKSKKYLDESLQLLRENNFPSTLIDALTFLGWYYSELGNYKKAVEFHEKTLELSYLSYPEISAPIGWASRNLGISYCNANNLIKAKSLLEKSYKIFKNLMGTDSIKTKWTLYELGKLYKKTGLLRKAKDAFEDCLKSYKNNYGYDSRHVAFVLSELGETYFLENNLEKAEPFLQESLRILTNTGITYSYSVLEVLSELYLKKSTLSYGKQKKVFQKQAVEYLKQALRILKQYFPTDCPHYKRIEKKLKFLKFI